MEDKRSTCSQDIKAKDMKPGRMPDEAIVNMYFARNEEALTETTSKYGRYLKTIALRILSNVSDAEECINDTYLAAWNSIPPAKPENLGTYLGKLLRRSCLMLVRRESASKRGGMELTSSMEELDEMVPDGSDFTEGLETEELAACISDFLKTRREDERNSFVLRYFYFYSIRDIAAGCGFSESKVKMLLKRTRDALAEILGKEGYVR